MKKFLDENSEFKGFYEEGMEVQINVAADDGEPYGKAGFRNEEETWFNARLGSERSRLPSYDIGKHAHSIGLSGWNYHDKRSRWVGFDFDSITTHKKGLSRNDLNAVLTAAKKIPWITARYSTSGEGVHLYVHFTTPVPTANRKEHARLAVAVLSNLSGLLNFDFRSRVDKAGGILWVWSRRANAESFKVIKSGDTLDNPPSDWKEQRLAKRAKQLTVNIKQLSLDESQKKLLSWFAKTNNTWWWDSELHMLVCHTFNLTEAHKALSCKGFFRTVATGKDCPNDQNCFMFPLKNGAWIVRRHSMGVKEDRTWRLDKSGWSYTYFNKLPTLADLSGLYFGETNEKGEHNFIGKDSFGAALKYLAPNVEIPIPSWLETRNFKVKKLKGARVVVKVEKLPTDAEIPGWVSERGRYEKVVDILEDEREIETPDNLIRQVIASGKEAGWYISARSQWINQPKGNVKEALVAAGYPLPQVTEILGQCILNPWELTAIPFQNEYPGNRQWNKYSPQLAYEPKEGDWSKWELMLDSIGKSLTKAVLKNSWCIQYEIKDGHTYLKMWIASIFQFPLEPLPYLFVYGPQLSGKSTFHEALALLVTNGIVRADQALKSKDGFNAELAGSVLCVIEETDLSKSKQAYERVKDWTTAKTVSIHEKGRTPFDLNNTTHWIQCANNSSYCPVLLGDTRIVILYVEKPKVLFAKGQMLDELRVQAPAFLWELLNTKIPPPIDRLRIPVVETEEKKDEQAAAANAVEQFILSECHYAPGHRILFQEFMARFKLWVDNPFDWSPIKVSRAIPLADNMPVKGRCEDRSQVALGNISFDEEPEELNFRYVKAGERIVKDTF